MNFPLITNIEQVREAIKDRPEFFEADRGEYIVFNYMVAHTDSFDCPIRRECRGLIFDKNGKVLSRRFHKFFNLGEKEYTQNDNIDWSKSHTILDKLDGSMISPLFINGECRWATKMGITDIALQCENFVKDKKNYYEFAKMMHDNLYTPIFEYISPSNRIVIEYPTEDLILLAIRHNETGEYLSLDKNRVYSCMFNIPLVEQYNGTLDGLKDVVYEEGVVIRFDDGDMIKVKTDWYIALHKAKENILYEKNVIKLILEEKDDDIIPYLHDNDKDRFLSYKEALINNIDLTEFYITEIITRYKNIGYTKKDFAINVAPTLDSYIKVLCFSCWDNTDNIRENILLLIKKNLGSQTSVDSIRDIIGVRW